MSCFSFMFLLAWNNFYIENLHSDQLELQIKSFLWAVLFYRNFRLCNFVKSSWVHLGIKSPVLIVIKRDFHIFRTRTLRQSCIVVIVTWEQFLSLFCVNFSSENFCLLLCKFLNHLKNMWNFSWKLHNTKLLLNIFVTWTAVNCRFRNMFYYFSMALECFQMIFKFSVSIENITNKM